MLIGQQAGGVFAERLWVQGDATVSRVQRLPALSCDPVYGAAWFDEGRHIGDRVANREAVASACEVHGLVEVGRPLRVYRDERDVGEIRFGLRRMLSQSLGLTHRVLRELLRKLQLGADFVQRPLESALDPGQPLSACWHGASLAKIRSASAAV